VTSRLNVSAAGCLQAKITHLRIAKLISEQARL